MAIRTDPVPLSVLTKQPPRHPSRSHIRHPPFPPQIPPLILPTRRLRTRNMAILPQAPLVAYRRRVVCSQVGEEKELDRPRAGHRRVGVVDHWWESGGVARSGELASTRSARTKRAVMRRARVSELSQLQLQLRLQSHKPVATLADMARTTSTSDSSRSCSAASSWPPQRRISPLTAGHSPCFPLRTCRTRRLRRPSASASGMPWLSQSSSPSTQSSFRESPPGHHFLL
jgi:hypothetical protein